MGTYASRRGPPDSPNVPDPFIFSEEEQVIDLMDQIEERGDLARDEITMLVRTLCIQLATTKNKFQPLETNPQTNGPTPRQIVFNWVMNDPDFASKKDGWWSGYEEVTQIDALLAALGMPQKPIVAQTISCPKCNGSGNIQGPFSDYDTWKCEHCKGTGKIKV